MQGARRVAERTQNCAGGVVDKLSEHAEECDSKVETCLRDKVCGCCKCSEQRLREEKSRGGEEYGEGKYGDKDALHE